MNNKLIVIIPIYNKEPKKTEIASLTQFSQAYEWKYVVRFVHPDSFNEDTLNIYRKLINTPENVYIQNKGYDDVYFKSTVSYSQLLKSKKFYIDCDEYDYMMIFQTDCWLMNGYQHYLDNIIDKGFDYIGAPILTNKHHWPSSPCCGNGGLSLRKISSFIKYTSNKELIDLLNKNDVYNKYEDVFFCEGISKHMYVDMPTWQECATFAWDMNPDILYKSNVSTPRIGIHAWPKNIPFWKDKIDIDNETYEEAVLENKEFIDLYYSK